MKESWFLEKVEYLVHGIKIKEKLQIWMYLGIVLKWLNS